MRKVIDLASLRDALNKTQIEMAELLGVGQSYISEIESGKKNVSKAKEEILIAQFGEDICEKYRIDKVDARIMPTYKGTVSGNTKIAHQITEGTNTTESDKDKEILDLKLEIAKLQGKIEEQEKFINKLLERK